MDSEVDVAIVGYGPVGQALAALLGRAGHRVAAFERFNEIYRLPRAVHIDHEIMRLLQALGLADAVAGEMIPLREYHWFGADGEPLMTLDAAAAGARRAGSRTTCSSSPSSRGARRARVRARPASTVHRGWVAEGLVDDADGATLTLRRHEEDEPGG